MKSGNGKSQPHGKSPYIFIPREITAVATATTMAGNEYPFYRIDTRRYPHFDHLNTGGITEIIVFIIEGNFVTVGQRFYLGVNAGRYNPRKE